MWSPDYNGDMWAPMCARVLVWFSVFHNKDVIMGAIASYITSLTSVYSTVYSSADQRKHQSSASLAFIWGIHRWPVNSPHKWPVTRKMFPFDYVIMWVRCVCCPWGFSNYSDFCFVCIVEHCWLLIEKPLIQSDSHSKSTIIELFMEEVQWLIQDTTLRFLYVN